MIDVPSEKMLLKTTHICSQVFWEDTADREVKWSQRVGWGEGSVEVSKILHPDFAVTFLWGPLKASDGRIMSQVS